MEIIEKLIGTVILRWYVFLFFAGYLFVAVNHLGWKRMLQFSLIGFTVGLLADYSSTHNGFPFGLYHYTGYTSNKEIFIGNVPLITALSFVFLSYLGYNIALFIYSPLYINKKDIQIVNSRAISLSKRVLFTGAFVMMLIDVLIDPITLKGEKWFLGDFYWYQYKGEHFGVPFTNYLGWYFVGFITILFFQQVEKYFLLSFRGKRTFYYIPFFGLSGVVFYFSIILFMLAVAQFIGETQIIVASIITFSPFVLLIFVLCIKKSNRANKKDIKVHLKDYPASFLQKILDREGKDFEN